MATGESVNKNEKASARLKSIFEKAVAIESIQSRTQYLTVACGNEPDLLNSVNQLLATYDASGSFLNRNAFGDDAGIMLSDRDQQTIGPYTLIEKIGEGSFGCVYKAEQKAPLSRHVAIKLIRPESSSEEVIKRFDVERQSLAMMDHLGIAKIFSAGTDEKGTPYFAMEFVDGVPVTEFARQNRCSVEERLKLIADACDALQHAHEKGVIHRDIKPSNILVTGNDGEQKLKFIDFGIAKILTPSPNSTQTYVGQLLGTPQYMSPEQAGGTPPKRGV